MVLRRMKFGKRYFYECLHDGISVGRVFPRAYSGWMFQPASGGMPSVGNTRAEAISGYFQSIGQEVTEQ